MENKKSFLSKLFNRKNDNQEVFDEECFSASESIIYSPLNGEVIPLSRVNDEVFSKGMMGDGIAIIPTEGKLYSPVSGKVSLVFKTKHAVGFMDKNNVEILIHIGMDTVELNGKYYKAHVKEGDSVKAGDLIMEFDIEKIKEAGYETVTPVVITNKSNFSKINKTDASNINVKDKIMMLTE